jgi:hypothetical protein
MRYRLLATAGDLPTGFWCAPPALPRPRVPRTRAEQWEWLGRSALSAALAHIKHC